MLKIFLYISVFCFSNWALSNPAAAELQKNTKKWDAFVKKHVKAKGIDYQGAEKDMASLKEFIDSYKKLKISSLDDNFKKAAYINLYNATMMYHIFLYAKEKKISVADKKFTSLKINDIDIPGGDIWSGDYKVEIDGVKVNLNNIEHQLIRGVDASDFSKLKVKKLDPRIHAAVNCAAKSCPPVRNLAYTNENIDSMLDENMKNFLSAEYQFKKTKKSLKANSIVFWYYSDFDDFAQESGMKGAGDYLVKFINKDAKDHSFKIKHLKENFNDRSRISLKLSSDFDWHYDWIINDIRNY